MEQTIFSVMKYTKNEVNPQVIKANATEIKKRIVSNCSEVPLKFEFERTGINPTNTRTVDLDFYNNPILVTPWSYNQQRSGFIYRVIHSMSYYLGEGNKLGVSDTEIFETFTKLTYSLQEIEAFTHRKEFDEYLFGCYLQTVDEEQQERFDYENAGLYDKMMMHNSTPDIIWKSIQRVTKDVKSLDSERHTLYSKLKYKQINGKSFDKLITPLDEQIGRNRNSQQYLLKRYKRMVDSQKYRRRHYLKMAFQTAKPYLKGVSYNPVECGTVSLCTFYIEEYCRWFNRTFKQEIVETSRLDKLAKRKQKRSERKKPNPRLEILKPFLNSGVPEQCIADQTGIPKSTVNRLMKKLV